jgi:hypothetical protein
MSFQAPITMGQAVEYIEQRRYLQPAILREFVTVGVPGLVGALSGMVPGAYSVTINYALPTFMPGFAFSPSPSLVIYFASLRLSPLRIDS